MVVVVVVVMVLYSDIIYSIYNLSLTYYILNVLYTLILSVLHTLLLLYRYQAPDERSDEAGARAGLRFSRIRTQSAAAGEW